MNLSAEPVQIDFFESTDRSAENADVSGKRPFSRCEGFGLFGVSWSCHCKSSGAQISQHDLNFLLTTRFTMCNVGCTSCKHGVSTYSSFPTQILLHWKVKVFVGRFTSFLLGLGLDQRCSVLSVEFWEVWVTRWLVSSVRAIDTERRGCTP